MYLSEDLAQLVGDRLEVQNILLREFGTLTLLDQLNDG